MQYKKRKLNGQFRSKKNSDILLAFHSSIVLFVLCLPVSLAINIPQSVTTYEAPRIEVRHVDAQEPTKVEKALRDIPHTSSTTDKVIRYLYEQAETHGIDGDQMAHTIYCESMFYSIQSGVVRNGVREPSFGIAQIHLPSHKTMTKAQAMDPYFAVDFMVENWDTTKKGIWHGYDRETDQCNNTIKEYWTVDN